MLYGGSRNAAADIPFWGFVLFSKLIWIGTNLKVIPAMLAWILISFIFGISLRKIVHKAISR